MRLSSGTLLLTALMGCNCSSGSISPTDGGGALDAGPADRWVMDSGEPEDHPDASVADVPDASTSTTPTWLGIEGWAPIPGTSPEDRCKVRQVPPLTSGWPPCSSIGVESGAQR